MIGVPIVNVQGFRRGSRYLPDRRDLNRYFPGNPNGSAAARIAHAFFTQVIENCDALVDLHTGSFERANLPQLRADLRNPDVLTLTQGFGSMVVLHSQPTVGTLRHAATLAGIPAVTVEAGGPSELEPVEVKHGVKGINTLLTTLGMVKRLRFWGDPEPVYYRSSWVRADNGGILLADVTLGSTVRKGDLLGSITDPDEQRQDRTAIAILRPHHLAWHATRLLCRALPLSMSVSRPTEVEAAEDEVDVAQKTTGGWLRGRHVRVNCGPDGRRPQTTNQLQTSPLLADLAGHGAAAARLHVADSCCACHWQNDWARRPPHWWYQARDRATQYRTLFSRQVAGWSETSLPTSTSRRWA